MILDPVRVGEQVTYGGAAASAEAAAAFPGTAGLGAAMAPGISIPGRGDFSLMTEDSRMLRDHREALEGLHARIGELERKMAERDGGRDKKKFPMKDRKGYLAQS